MSRVIDPSIGSPRGQSTMRNLLPLVLADAKDLIIYLSNKVRQTCSASTPLRVGNDTHPMSPHSIHKLPFPTKSLVSPPSPNSLPHSAEKEKDGLSRYLSMKVDCGTVFR